MLLVLWPPSVLEARQEGPSELIVFNLGLVQPYYKVTWCKPSTHFRLNSMGQSSGEHTHTDTETHTHTVHPGLHCLLTCTTTLTWKLRAQMIRWRGDKLRWSLFAWKIRLFVFGKRTATQKSLVLHASNGLVLCNAQRFWQRPQHQVPYRSSHPKTLFCDWRQVEQLLAWLERGRCWRSVPQSLDLSWGFP